MPARQFYANEGEKIMKNYCRVRALDKSFHAIIVAINRGNTSKIKASYRSWLAAREGLEPFIKEATKSGNLTLVSAIDKFIEASHFCLDGDDEQLVHGYPDYLAARDNLLPLVFARIIANAHIKLNLSNHLVQHGIDVKQLLQGDALSLSGNQISSELTAR